MSIDECMIHWRGRLSFRQFIANKPIWFGIKVWVLADSESKYIYKQQLYIGRNPGERAEVGLATRVEKEFMFRTGGFWSPSVYRQFLHQCWPLPVFMQPQYLCLWYNQVFQKEFPKANLVWEHKRGCQRYKSLAYVWAYPCHCLGWQ